VTIRNQEAVAVPKNARRDGFDAIVIDDCDFPRKTFLWSR
jgi:hypothetical protein